MTKIAIIGAGGYEFPLQLMNDFLSFDSTKDATYSLMDIDAGSLRRTERLARRLVEAHALTARIEPTTNRREALRGADFVVVCFQVGGRDAYAIDMEIPRRYGIDQTVGDTLGPGGVFRGLRSMSALDEIVSDMRELCPDALMLNYANPMAINCWFVSTAGIRVTGLCHSVQHTADELADIMGLEAGEWSFRAAGINHQAWMLDFRHRGRDVMPELRAAVAAYHRGDLAPARPLDEWYAGGREGVRTAIMDLTGFFQTESSHHASEYYPHFRRSAEDVRALLPQRWDYLEITQGNNDAELERLADDFAAGTLAVSEEYAARIVDSVVTNTPRVVYGNVPNTGLITNLPNGSCVEVPCLVDQNGVQPTFVGDLPAACAGINLASVGYQHCVVEAYRQRSKDLIYAAASLDRLTSSLLSLDQIRRMCDEMIEAQQQWLPDVR
ncbi:alpha-galactosidase [Asanoa ferruginea]|uniref:Alpha-galactosidase n=1 Tax=Asanoa ferruginea TaxID=53367 RepID=A0A3E0A0L4_9ACTN|nr:alpha-galactosidase [Asanoa ferruginea]REF99720.1 alpha-galactosidase [Asanoa ferruginea]GIF50431.1 alpha-glucosidase/alpha-galactosidase [Asanoa ferruginea]